MLTARQCPHCGSENLPHRRYCRECGVAFEARCPKCGFANLIGDLYCGGCGDTLVSADGTALAVWQAPATIERPPRYQVSSALADRHGALDPALLTAAENRVTSVVKADLSGFTAMSELLGDPEEVTVIMNQVFEPLVDAVRTYEGYVDNYAGDMIIALFGAPVTLEASAERAVRAALEMRAAVARVNARGISHGVELGISTGVATGASLWGEVGAGASRRQTLSGAMGDYAALLEKYTERGCVGICPDTERRVRGILPCVPQEGSHVVPPGETQASPLFYAELPAGRPSWLEEARAAAGSLPRCGRDKLGRVLTEQWELARGGKTVFVHLTGEPGAGKTRLLLDTAQLVLAEGGRLVAVGARALSRALGDSLAADLGAQLGGRALAEVAKSPTMVVLDGLDRAENWPIGVLEALPADLPALVVTCSRDRRPLEALRAAGRAVEVYQVPPLDAEAVEQMAGLCLGRDAQPFESDWLWRWTEGNPSFVRGLCEWLAGVSASSEPELEAQLRKLPWRLREYADAALDALDEPARAAAYAAAVAADPDELALAPELVGYLLAGDEWARALERMEAAGLVWSEEEPLRLVWRHRCVQFVAQQRLVDSVRAQLEARAAVGRERLADAEA